MDRFMVPWGRMDKGKTKSTSSIAAALIIAVSGFVVAMLPNAGLAQNLNSNTAAVDLNTNAVVPAVPPVNTNTDQGIAAPAATVTTPPDPVADLNSQIEANKKRLQDLQQQETSYQQAVDQANGKVRDIQTQISAIDSQIAQTNFLIQTKQEEISTLELEMAAVQRQIDKKNSEIDGQKANLSDSLKRLDANSRTSTLALVLTHASLGEFYSQAEAIATISDSLSSSIASLQVLKKDLLAKQDEFSQTKDDLQQSKLQLQVQKQSTVDQRDTKDALLGSAQNSVGSYNELLQQSQLAEQQANSTISALEKQIQAKLSQSGPNQPVFSSTGFIWPVVGTITAYFHDPTYPFDCKHWNNPNCMAHSAIDIGVPQGTPVRAAADGVVSAVNDQGFYTNAAGQKTRSALNYVAVCHDDNCNVSSRYLHLSVIYVKPMQNVKQGDIIGLSGGLPGTAGAGGMTTGAHLHFEIRESGLPVDPLRYLPAS